MLSKQLLEIVIDKKIFYVSNRKFLLKPDENKMKDLRGMNLINFMDRLHQPFLALHNLLATGIVFINFIRFYIADNNS